jgi:hypothetical protein
MQVTGARGGWMTGAGASTMMFGRRAVAARLQLPPAGDVLIRAGPRALGLARSIVFGRHPCVHFAHAPLPRHAPRQRTGHRSHHHPKPDPHFRPQENN